MSQIDHEELVSSYERALEALAKFFETLPPTLFLDSTGETSLIAHDAVHSLALFGMKMVRMTVPQGERKEFEGRVVHLIDQLAEAAVKEI